MSRISSLARLVELLLSRAAFPSKLIAVVLMIACATSSQALDASAALLEAKSAFARGEYLLALGVVRTMRMQSPNSPYLPEALLLAARAALISEPFRARFFIDKARDHPQASNAVRFEIAVTAAELARREGLLTLAITEFQAALRLSSADVSHLRMDQVRLQAAELALYELQAISMAAYLALQIVDPTALMLTERRTYDRLVQDVLWSTITPQVLGLPDGNISAITVDGDDVWIGTSNGGVARYSQSTGIVRRFTSGSTGGNLSDTIRAIEVDDHWVWLGTSEGLSVYSKATSRLWRVERFTTGQGVQPNVWALEGIDGGVAAGTLGSGLWLADDPDGEWRRVQDKEAVVRFVQALVRKGPFLYIGTLDRGVVVMHLGTERIRRVDRLWAAGAKNIQALTFDDAGKLWIGDKGNGLYRWDPESDEVNRYSQRSGAISDDFVLAVSAAPGEVLIGTFGGGAYRYSLKYDEWTHFDMTPVVDCPSQRGMGANEIRAVAEAGPLAYLGTQGCGVAVVARSLQYAAGSSPH